MIRMLKYKNMSVEEVVELGNVVLVDGMINSVNSKKSRNRNNEEVVKECKEVLEKLNNWKMENGFVKSGKRSKYESVVVGEMSEEDLNGMYESLYSRRSYYIKIGNSVKVKEIEEKIEKVKEEKKVRSYEKMKKELGIK